MAAKKTALEHLAQIVAEHPHSPVGTRVPVTVGELRDLSTRIDWLSDMVVSAAALHTGRLSRQESEYVEEELLLVAADLEKSGLRRIPASPKRSA
jgi:hypothetical protein